MYRRGNFEVTKPPFFYNLVVVKRIENSGMYRMKYTPLRVIEAG